MTRSHRPRPPARAGALLAVLVFLAAGVLYLEAVPAWEAPDEPWHMVYAEVVASGAQPTPEQTYESHQPPLYYIWPAYVLRVLDLERVPRAPDNPRYPFAHAAYMHPPGEPGAGLLRLVRAFSGLLGVLSVALTWASARALMPGARRRPLLAALVVALLPQHVFISHTVSNDTLATAVGALVVYAALRLVTGRGRARRPTRTLALLVLALGAGVLTKLNVAALLPAAVLAIALVARERAPRPRRVAGAGVATGAVVLAGATFLHLQLPGTLAALAEQARARALEVNPDYLDPWWLAPQLGRLATSTWARFGWLNVDFPAPVYGLVGLTVLLAAPGLVRAVRSTNRPQRNGLIVLATALGALLAAAAKNLLIDPQAQGRLTFPALAALAVLLAVGWLTPLGTRRRALAVAVLATLLLGANVYATTRLLPRTYAPWRGAPPAYDLRVLPAEWTVAARLRGDGVWVRQGFHVYRPGLRRVEVFLAKATGDGLLELRLRDARGRQLARATHPLHTLAPNDWLGVDVGPLAHSAGADYTVELVLRGGAGAEVWLWGAPSDVYPEGELTVNGAPGTDLVLLTLLDEATAP